MEDLAVTVLRGPGLVLRLDLLGTVVAAAGPAPTDPPWLSGAGVLTLDDEDGPVDLGNPAVSVGADEVEVTRTAGGLQAVIRHTVDDAGWNVRVVLANDSAVERVVRDVRLEWRPAPATVVTALSAGAEAAYAVQRADGTGPLLVGRLRSGSQPGADARGLLLGSLVLGPGHRWAAQWRWTVVADAAHAVTTDELPRTVWLDLDRPVLLPAGPDVAVLAPDLEVEVREGRVEVSSARPGSWPVELRSVRGTTTYALTWAPDLDALVDAAAAAALAGPTSPGGTARLGGACAGLLVQDALTRRSVEDPDAAAEALELLAGLLVEQLDDRRGDADPSALLLLTREADRTGETALLDAASEALLAVSTPVAGTGLAGLGVALALARAGRSTEAFAVRLADLLEVADPATGPGLELALLLGQRPGLDPARSYAGLRRLGAALGAGLPGRSVPALEPSVLAYGATVLGLVDEYTGGRLRTVWGISTAELARRAAAEARARTGERSTGPDRSTVHDEQTLAWLVLGRAPR